MATFNVTPAVISLGRAVYNRTQLGIRRDEEIKEILQAFVDRELGPTAEYTREEVEQMDEQDLDEIVHELKSQEAAEINNAGKDAQITYILGEEETL